MTYTARGLAYKAASIVLWFVAFATPLATAALITSAFGSVPGRNDTLFALVALALATLIALVLAVLAGAASIVSDSEALEREEC